MLTPFMIARFKLFWIFVAPDMKDYDIVPPGRMWEDHVDRVDRYLRRRQDFNEMLFGSFGRDQKVTPIKPRLKADSSVRSFQIPRAHSAPVSFEVESTTPEEWVQDAIPAPPPLRPNLSNYSQDSSLRSIQIAEQKALLGSFEDFWTEHCQIYAKLSLRLFYLGVVSLLVSLALLMHAKLQYTYHNKTAAMTFLSFIFISIAGTLYVIVGIKNNVDLSISERQCLEFGADSLRHIDNLPIGRCCTDGHKTAYIFGSEQVV